MDKDYRVGRQHEHLGSDGIKFNHRFAAIENVFSEKWLSESNSVVAALWRRKDSFAVNQLYMLGAAIESFMPINERWVSDHVKKIKSSDANGARGSMFELLGANLFQKSPQVIQPLARSNPGFDLELTVGNGSKADISLKSFGTSSHEAYFKVESEKVEVASRKFFAERKVGGVLFAIANAYPGAADWKQLTTAIGTLKDNVAERVGIWAVKRGSLPEDYKPYSPEHISYQVFFGAPYHKNETLNLYSKFNDAFANATTHADAAAENTRVVVMRVPETISLEACKRWTEEYFAHNVTSLVDAVLLYQLAVVDLESSKSLMVHSFLMVETPQYQAWKTAKGRSVGLVFNAAVGVGGDPTFLKLTDGPLNATFEEGYYYQHGEFFTEYLAERISTVNVRNITSGVFQHAVIRQKDGTSSVIEGQFPHSKNLEIFL